MKTIDHRKYIRLSDISREAFEKPVEILTEATRSQLISKSQKSDDYQDKSKGRNRWERRTKSQIADTVSDYSRIDMNTLFRGDMLEFGVRVRGETNNYVVTILFEHLLPELQKQIRDNHNKLEYKCILRALTTVFNSEDVYVSCQCDDWKYRGAYWSSKGNYNSGTPQNSNGKGIQNPNDTKGAGCKHINLVLSNLKWLMKIASVINNYIYYCKDHMEYNYSRYIFPVLYNMPYEKAVQMSLSDYDSEGNIVDDMQSDEDIINLSNMLGKVRGRYRKGEPSVNPRSYELKRKEEEEKKKKEAEERRRQEEERRKQQNNKQNNDEDSEENEEETK